MVKIYTRDTGFLDSKDAYESFYVQMSLHRREKIDRMKFERDKKLSLGVGVLLAEAMRDFGLEAYVEGVSVGAFGKPFVPAADDVFKFSLSHSGTKVMCAVSFSETGKAANIGCDVEKTGADKTVLAERFFSDGEKALFAGLSGPERVDLFYRLWTHKESFVKALGNNVPLNSFSINITDGKVSVSQSFSDKAYFFEEPSLDDGYKYSVCVEGIFEL